MECVYRTKSFFFLRENIFFRLISTAQVEKKNVFPEKNMDELRSDILSIERFQKNKHVPLRRLYNQINALASNLQEGGKEKQHQVEELFYKAYDIIDKAISLDNK